jgi:ABC-type lipoprotein release transport system permease subunit
MKILSMALRNLGRNRTRTAITVFSMAFAGFIMVLYMAMAEGFSHTLEKNTIGMNLGEVQIHAEGYRSDPDLYKRIENPAAVMEMMRAKGFHCVPRLYGFGLAAFGNSSSGVWLRGVDLVNEPTVTMISGNVLSGSWLENSDPKGVVIGRKLAHTLGLKPGDETVVISQASDGSMANDIYRVRGILKTVGDAIDQSGFFMLDSEFRRLMAVPEGVHEIAMVRGDRTWDLGQATDAAKKALPGLEVKNWKELQPILARLMDLMGVAVSFMMVIAYSAVGMIILNAMLMNVFERIREFGIMKALGVSPWRIFWLINAEALITSVFAGVITLAFGIPSALHFQEKGIDLSAFSPSITLSGMAMDTVFHFRVTPHVLIMPVLFMFALVVIATLYPSIKAAVIRPLEALHHQ